MDKAYDHKAVEENLYKKWEEAGYFKPSGKGEPYSIVLPPPNVTGTLHIGHALMLVIQDILIRYHRMKGFNTLWLPGTDHAAIATQSKVEAEIYKKEEKTRHDLGREELLRRVEEFAQNSHNTIVNQMRRMGASVDWSREAYTLDDARSLAVRTAFKKMYDEQLIYKGARIVNWDPKLQTTVSDDEIEWKEEKSPLYYLQYGPFVIATARPETKFGDKYVVMHPDDERYKEYKDGQQIEVEWINGKVLATVIKDEAIDMKFGTGVMTITPWHDRTDFEIAQRHNLDKEQIIDFKGLLLPIAGEFAGQHIKKARNAIVEKLKEKGLLVKMDENYTHRLATNSRGGGTIEPQIKEQWFVDVNKEFPFKQSDHAPIQGLSERQTVTLKKLMRHVVESKQIEITPSHFEKIYYHWIDNLRDWCISRQIWYGHRIPVWYKDGEVYCDITPPEGDGWEQDPDTLDTWFSSGLWTFSTLGWPNQTEDFKVFHPTSVLETGYDILFFWVARMILMSTYLLGEVPFRKVLLHGLVRDAEKQKMSKSKGNIIDPLDEIEKYGTDALRIALIFSTAAGSDIPLSEDKIRGMKHFSNKLWNIGRFINMQFESETFKGKEIPFYTQDAYRQLGETDKQVVDQLDVLTKDVSRAIDQFRLHEASQMLYDFAWHTLADVYVERSKEELSGGNVQTLMVIRHVWITLLKLLHPFMPYVTEEIWQKMPRQNDAPLIITNWPQ